MSELQPDALAADDLAPPVETPDAPAQASADPAAPAPPEDEDPAEGLTETEEKLNALRQALTATRGKLRESKVQAEKTAQLEQQIAQWAPLMPYAQFVAQNPQLLQQPPAPPAAPVTPQVDPQIEATARRFSLYKQDGSLDLETAGQIIADMRQTAQEAAERAVAPVQQSALAQRAQANLARLTETKDAFGRPLQASVLRETIGAIASALPPDEAARVLADPGVAEIISMVAKQRQADTIPYRAQAPAPGPALHVESAGGGTQVHFSDGSKQLFSKAGVSEKDARASASRFRPGQSNVLE